MNKSDKLEIGIMNVEYKESHLVTSEDNTDKLNELSANGWVLKQVIPLVESYRSKYIFERDASYEKRMEMDEKMKMHDELVGQSYYEAFKKRVGENKDHKWV